MGALEALSGELACRYITDAEITRIQELHERMVRKYEAGALRDYFKLNEQIHQLILAAARNPTLAQMQLSLSGRVRRARYMANIDRKSTRLNSSHHSAAHMPSSACK